MASKPAKSPLVTEVTKPLKQAKQDDFVRITLRLPPNLHEALTKAAGPRSLNAEIASRLEASFYSDASQGIINKVAYEAAEAAVRASLHQLQSLHEQIVRNKPEGYDD